MIHEVYLITRADSAVHFPSRWKGNAEIERLVSVKDARRAKGLECRVVVTGCMVNLDKEAMLTKHPGIDHLVTEMEGRGMVA